MAGINTPFSYKGFETETGYVEVFSAQGGPNDKSAQFPNGSWTGFLRYYASKAIRDENPNGNVETDTDYGVLQCAYVAGEDPMELLLTKLHNEWFPGGTIV